MSRYIDSVPMVAAAKVFGEKNIPHYKKYVRSDEAKDMTVEVAHGYDRQLSFYFCDLQSSLDDDEPVGIFYGNPFGLSKQLSKEEYVQALKDLTLHGIADYVQMDMAY